jgi:TRAP-type C4-dicarboxylate transport system permease small subunit
MPLSLSVAFFIGMVCVVMLNVVLLTVVASLISLWHYIGGARNPPILFDERVG